MIQITPQMRVLVAVEATDFRRGIDGLAQLCRAGLGADPFICGAASYVAGGRSSPETTTSAGVFTATTVT